MMAWNWNQGKSNSTSDKEVDYEEFVSVMTSLLLVSTDLCRGEPGEELTPSQSVGVQPPADDTWPYNPVAPHPGTGIITIMGLTLADLLL